MSTLSENKQLAYITQRVIEEVVTDTVGTLESDVRRLQHATQVTLDAMQSAEQVATLAADKMVRRLRGPLYRARRR